MQEIKKYRVYKICPKCNHGYADYWVKQRKIGEKMDYTNPENSTVTYTRTKHFKCRACGHHRTE